MKNQFSITPFTNESGSQSWRCHGMLNGERKRANFKTQPEAVVQMQNWQCEAMNLPTKAIVASKLTQEQTDEAESCFYRLRDHTLTLTAAIEFALRNWVTMDKTITVKDAYPLFIADKNRSRQGGLAFATAQKLHYRLKPLIAALGDKLMHEVLPEHLDPLIFREGSGDVNRHTVMMNFTNFFNWAVFRGFCVLNPMKKIQKIKLNYGEPVVMTLAQSRAVAKAALAYKSGEVAPYVTLALFCGMRPTEIARMEQMGAWDNIDLAARTIILGPKMVKGGRARRIVEIPEAAIAFLTPHALKRSPFILPNHRRRLEGVRKLAGLAEWVPDLFRHTAISFHFAQSNNENTTAKWAGNSPAVIHQHYRGTVRAADVPQFWAIRPGDGGIITLSAKAA